METIRKVAVMCIARAVMFGTLAIVCVMVAFAFSPPAAFRTGAMLTLVMAVVLLLKAQYALHQKPRHTEIWLYLDERTRPGDEEAGRRFAEVLREVYGRFAAITFATACGLFLVSMLMMAAGMEIQGLAPAVR